MVPMARILVVGVVFTAAPCAFAELKPTRQPISANAAAETNFMLSPLCVSLRRPGGPVGRHRLQGRRIAKIIASSSMERTVDLASLGPVGRSATMLPFTDARFAHESGRWPASRPGQPRAISGHM